MSSSRPRDNPHRPTSSRVRCIAWFGLLGLSLAALPQARSQCVEVTNRLCRVLRCFRTQDDRQAHELLDNRASTVSQGSAAPGLASAAAIRRSHSWICQSGGVYGASSGRLSQIRPINSTRCCASRRSMPNCDKVKLIDDVLRSLERVISCSPVNAACLHPQRRADHPLSARPLHRPATCCYRYTPSHFWRVTSTCTASSPTCGRQSIACRPAGIMEWMCRTGPRPPRAALGAACRGVLVAMGRGTRRGLGLSPTWQSATCTDAIRSRSNLPTCRGAVRGRTGAFPARSHGGMRNRTRLVRTDPGGVVGNRRRYDCERCVLTPGVAVNDLLEPLGLPAIPLSYPIVTVVQTVPVPDALRPVLGVAPLRKGQCAMPAGRHGVRNRTWPLPMIQV